ncbi:MAG: GMC family oxidoreductase [Acidobacteriota bacterium]
MKQALEENREYDYIVVGSGFGGSVSALRLSEKGYRVLVVEMGKRWPSRSFPKSNWNLRKFLWMPRLLCYGIQQLTLLKDVLVLHGAGVGGGSLVYANTLLEPLPEAFRHPRWKELNDWKTVLAPFYDLARRMLGSAPNVRETPADHVLRRIAKETGREDTYEPTDVAVFFGEPDVEVPDPYFNGEGPARTGCNFCGGCMVGCRYNAKNTLDKNYLYLAEKAGAEILPETRVRLIRPREGGGYVLDVERSTSVLFKRRRSLHARGLVLSAGVLGTVPLLLKCREAGTLPGLSDRLGRYTRTNSESLQGVRVGAKAPDYTQGVAITSRISLDEQTTMEPVRYPPGSDVMTLLATVFTGPGNRLTRPLKWAAAGLRHPGAFLKSVIPFGRAKRSLILLYMQSVDNHLRLVLRRRWFWPFERGVTSRRPQNGERPPVYIPITQHSTRRAAEIMGGHPQSTLNEVFLNIPTTAHILGGCAMGKDASEGVVDRHGRVFGYENFYVADGSIIGANLGVNPSLTITALTEYIMDRIPERDDRRGQGES